MDEFHKLEIRNYAMATGFFILAVSTLLMIISNLTGVLTVGGTRTDFSSMFMVEGPLLIIIGIILIIMKKRDLTALIFIISGMSDLFLIFANDTTVRGMVLTCMLRVGMALLILTSKDKKKYLLFLIPLTQALPAFWLMIPQLPETAYVVVLVVQGVLELYFALACASERIALPGGKLLTSDATTNFKDAGSAIGYLVFSISTAVWVAVYFFGLEVSVGVLVDEMCGLMLILTGILLFACAKMRFTPMMFIMMGFLVYIGHIINGPLFIGVGVMFIVVGLFAALRKESRLIPATMLILYGVTYFIAADVLTIGSSVPVLSGILNFIVTIISVFLAFLVFS